MRNVYTVSQVNSYIKNMFSQDFMLTSIKIQGEASNVKYHGSGHIYFTLKDGKSAIACVMFAGNRAGLSFPLKDGNEIIVNGNVDVYERDGKYQIYAKEITLAGSGALYARFEALKKELFEMGMFDDAYKQPVPKVVKTLGIVTAPTGAAVRDIIQVAKRRNPYIHIIIYPAIVQGEMAAESIIKGIHALEHLKVDTMIVGRGGGSIEDLWAFNEREVAETIFNCSIPVISAVGHETDYTIADFVSDLRAPTPSAAAELAVADYYMVKQALADLDSVLNRTMHVTLEQYQMQIEKYKLTLQHKSPLVRLKEQKMYIIGIEERLQNAIKGSINSKHHAFELYLEKMKGLSPLEKLNQGYGFVEDKAGKSLTDVTNIKKGDSIYVHLKNGIIEADVTKIESFTR